MTAPRTRRPIDPTVRDTFVYWFLDSEGRTLYIGITRNPSQRWRSHNQNSPGLTAGARGCKMRGPYTRPVALSIERAAILAENPLFNFEVDKQHKHDAVHKLNEAARLAEQKAVLGRYGIEVGA